MSIARSEHQERISQAMKLHWKKRRLRLVENQGNISVGASNLLKTHSEIWSASFPKGKAAGVREPQGPGLLLTGSKLPSFCGSSKPYKNGAQQQPFKRAPMRAKSQAESAKIYPFPLLDTCDRIDNVRLRIDAIEMAILGLSETYGRSSAGSGVQIMLAGISEELKAISNAIHEGRG